jgi:hypothetical protein
VSDTSPPLTKERVGGVNRAWPRLRLIKLAASVLFVLLLTSLGYAGYAWWTAPLFADDFKSGWFDSSKWRAPPEIIEAGGVFAEKGHIRLINRGYLVTNQEFKQPIELSFDWKWSQLGLLPKYADHLAIALRTTGVPRQTHSYEVEDGVVLKFDAYGGNLILSQGSHDEPTFLLPQGTLPLPQEQWHQIRVTDDGETISVYVSGPAIPDAFAKKPVAQITVKYQGKANPIALYNREMLKSIPHESSIRAFVVRALK